MATKPAEWAPAKMKAVEVSKTDSAMEPDFLPLLPTQPRASMSTKTKPMVQQTTIKRKAVEAPVSDPTTESNSPLVPSQPNTSSKSMGQKTATSKKRVNTVPSSDSPAPSHTLNSKPPAPLKSKQKRVASPAVDKTEPDLPPPEPKPCSLQ